ncbi:MAG: hypothetical protein HY270_00655 [Deltaproteobacteria bacterium]|nr:hypothetical protein [Deltaproteobacteria bacterium]
MQRSRSAAERGDAESVRFLLFAACIVFWGLRVWPTSGDQVQIFANFDVVGYWLPLLREAARQWRAGIVPLWNPYQALGTPLMATQQVAALYPLNALYLILPLGSAWLFTSLLHHLIATFAMYAWCRRLSLRPMAAATGGVAYGFSSILIGKVIYLPDELICLAWLPALFACCETVIASPSPRAVATMAIVWALHVLGGDADTIVRSAWLLATYALVRLGTDPDGAAITRVRVVLALAIAAVLTAGLTAAQWLPTLELAELSVRAPGSLAPAQQAAFTAPLWEMLVERVRGVPTLSSASSLILVLGISGFCLWSRRSVAWFFALAAVLIGLLSIGPATPLFVWLQNIPTLSWFRVPGRWLNLLPLCLAVLAAAGSESLLWSPAPRRSGRAGFLLVLALLLSAKVATLVHLGLWRLWVLALFFDAVPLALLLLLKRRSRQMTTRRPLVVANLLAIFFVVATPVLLYQPDTLPAHRVDELYRPFADVFDRLRAAGPSRVLSLLPIGDGRAWAKIGTYFEVPVLNDFEPLSSRDFEELGRLINGADGSDAYDVFTGALIPPRQHLDPRLLDLLAVRFVIASPEQPSQVSQWLSGSTPWKVRFRSSNAVVYENPQALSRAFFVAAAQARVVTQHCADELLSATFEVGRDLLVAERNPVGSEPVALGEIESLEIGPQRVRAQLRAAGAGYLVLSDAFYPGWRATVDGTVAPIVRADCFLRAVAVDAGRHTVVFEYAPQSFRLASLLSGMTFLAVIIGYASAQRRV